MVMRSSGNMLSLHIRVTKPEREVWECNYAVLVNEVYGLVPSATPPLTGSGS